MVINMLTMEDKADRGNGKDLGKREEKKREKKRHCSSLSHLSNGSVGMTELTGITESHQEAVFHPDNQRDWLSGWGWKVAKWSAMGMGGDKYRWFVLENTRLAYWKSETERFIEKKGKEKNGSSLIKSKSSIMLKEARNQVDLMSVEALQTCYLVHAKERRCGQHGIHLMTAERTYTIMLPSLELRNRWRNCLLEALARLGHPLLLSRVSQQFSRVPMISLMMERDAANVAVAESKQDAIIMGVGYGQSYGEVDEMLCLKETMSIRYTDMGEKINLSKRLPLCPASCVSLEVQSASVVSAKEENVTAVPLLRSTFNLYDSAKNILMLSELIHMNLDEIGRAEDTPKIGLTELINNVGESLLQLELQWDVAEKQAFEHTENMRQLYKIKVNGCAGWLTKPDFKKCENKEKWEKHRGLLKYQKRWFVLDGMELRYYKSDPKMSRARKIPKAKGVVRMENVVEVRPSLAPKAPKWSLDVLVTTGEYYILGTESAQEQMCWGVHLTRCSKCPTNPAFQGIV